MKTLARAIGIVGMGLALVAGVSAQSPATQVSVPQWQIDAGGKMAFDVVSVKLNKSGPPQSLVNPDFSGDLPNSNVPMTLGDEYAPTGGLFAGTNLTFVNYLVFAHKITGNQFKLLLPLLPKWANTDRFDIQARTERNPTKDQMRLMMQSVLADRFKLTMHHETQRLPVLALVLAKPGKTGPQLQPHSDGSPCTTAPASPQTPARTADTFPNVCGSIQRMPSRAAGRVRLGARKVTMALIESALAGYGQYDAERPMLDQTGLSGTFDFSFEWTPQLNGPPLSGASGESGPTFLQALAEQLGLKLEPQMGPVDVLVIDHVERPSEN